MSGPSVPDARLLEMEGRGVRGRDVLFLRQWFGLSIAETCYLLGITAPKWYQCQHHPDRLVEDASVALLVWALLRFPEAQYLPTFPDPAEVYPLYQNAAERGHPNDSQLATAFGLLLGRERLAPQRWLTAENPSRVPPTVRRLLFALRGALLARGVPGFEAWIERARFEARSRGLDFDTMASWRPPAPAPAPSAATAKRARGRPRRPQGSAKDGESDE